MKKYIAAVLLLSSMQSMAQKKLREFGFQTGVNINSAYGNALDKSHTSTLTGLGIGIHFKLNLSAHFGIKAIMQFDQNGYSFRSLTFNTAGNTLSAGDALSKINYINLPVLAEYNTGNTIKFTAGIGVFAGFLASNHLVIKIKEPVASTSKSNSSSTQSFNFGLAAETGIQIPLQQKLNLSIGIHDNFGLLNTNKNFSSPANSSNIKTNALSFLAGISFTL